MQVTKICKTCQKPFFRKMNIDGKIHDLKNRTRCLECVPLNSYRPKGSGKPRIKKTPETDLRHKTKYDWAEIQKEYNIGSSIRDCQKKFGFSLKAYYCAKNRGVLKLRTIKEAKILGLSQGKFKQNWTPEARKKQSENAKRRGLGGNRNSHKINYGGFLLDSTYEVRVAKVLDSQNIKWVKPKTTFAWEDSNRVSHKYYPDLFLPDYNIYLDPKNSYLIKRDLPKIEIVSKTHNINLKIVPIKTIEKWEKTGFIIEEITNSDIIWC